ncbi:MAG: hypothetical protein R3C49_23560 [Planctomycetaceae bacterium]
MNWLRCLLSVAAMFGVCCACNAQEVQLLTVSGDISAPGNYSFPADQPVLLMDLLVQAGLDSSGQAQVFSGQPLKLETARSLRLESPIDDTVSLTNNSIVVFRRFREQPNAVGHVVVLTDAAPLLLAVPGEGVTLDRLFASAGLGISEACTVTQTAWGDIQTVKGTPDQIVHHGDLIDQRSGSPAAAQNQPFQFATAPAATPPVVTASAAPEPQESFGSEHRLRTVQPLLRIPAENQDSSPFNVGRTERLAERTPADEYVGAGQMELRSTAQTVPQPVTQPRIAEDSGVSQKQSRSASSPLMNGLLVAGLLTALALISVGWLKTQREREQQQQMSASLRASLSESPAIPQTAPAVGNNIASSELAPFETDDEDVDLQIAATVVTDVQTSGDAETFHAAPTEPFDDSLDSVFTDVVDDDCPVLSAGLEEQTQDIRRTEEVLIDAGCDEPAAEITAKSLGFREIPELTSADQTDDGCEDTATEAFEPYTVSELEEMVRNRIPMDLCEARLPLRVALFGTPAGPRRLRIDAAHTEIAPPHMAAAARRSTQKEPAAAVAATRDNARTTERSRPATGKQQTRMPAASESASGTSISRFDRALNTIEEQADR